MQREFQFKSVGEPVRDEEHGTWSLEYLDAQGAHRKHRLHRRSARPEMRQMLGKYAQIREHLKPPFLVEYAVKAADKDSKAEIAARTKRKRQRRPT